MNRKGFVSTAMIYTFFILFLILMVFLLNKYSSTRFLVDRYRYDIEEELFEAANADINLYIFVWNNTDQEYKYIDNYLTDKSFESNKSYCKKGSTINYVNNEIVINARQKDYCYAYFR